MRRRYGYLYDNLENNEILLYEFEFSNKIDKLITEEELQNIKEQIKNDNKKIIMFSNEKLLQQKIIIRFQEKTIEKTISAKKIEKTDIYAKTINIVGKWDKKLGSIKNIIDNILPKVKSIEDSRILLGFNYNTRTAIHDTRVYNLDYKANKIRGLPYHEIQARQTILFFENLKEILNFEAKEGEEQQDDIRQIATFTTIESVQEHMKEIFDIETGKIEPPKFIDVERYASISYILKVIEKREENQQFRYAIMLHEITQAKPEYNLYLISEKNKFYNYIDEKKFCLLYRNKKLFTDTGLIPQNENQEYDINIKALQDIDNNSHRLFQENEHIITKSLYEFYCKRDTIIKKSENEGTIIEQKIYDKYIEKLEKDEEIIINNITLSKTKIEYKEQNIKIEFEEKIFDIIDNFRIIKRRIEKIHETDFGEFLVGLIKPSQLKDFQDNEENRIKINDIPIIITQKEDRYYINNIFVRIDDIDELIVKAVCYTDIKDYEHYLDDVSHIGMDWKNKLSNGINVTIQTKGLLDTSPTKEILMRFSFLWDTKARSKIYLMIDNQKYLIKYKPNFMKYFEGYHRQSISLTELIGCLTESVEGITSENALNLIDNAIKEAKIVKERGEELVRETIRDTKAQKGDYDNKKGYYIVGIRGNKYFIDEQLNVYKYKEGQYHRRCVVDVAGKHRIYEDRLANRLVNIYNENPRISTIQG